MTFDNLSPVSTIELLAGYRKVLAELRSRGVLRTNNAPTGDYAESLVHRYLGGELAPNSEKSWDVRASDGTTVQVKARILTAGSGAGERQLSIIRTWEFDSLAVVLFEDDYTVRRSVLIPSRVARELGAYVEHVNGYRVIANDGLLDHPEAADITEGLRATAVQS